MPSIEVDTSCDLSEPGMKETLAATLSRLIAEGLGKPEQYVMVCIRERATMTMSGEAGPCALVAVKSIGGLSKPVNQALADKITRTLRDKLAVHPDRVYVVFQELTGTHWAWNGKTFA